MNRNGAGDAFAREPAHPYQAGQQVKLNAMRTVIEVVVRQLEDRRIKLAPGKLADLIVLIYEHLATEEVEEEQVKQTASRYLRLVV